MTPLDALTRLPGHPTGHDWDAWWSEMASQLTRSARAMSRQMDDGPERAAAIEAGHHLTASLRGLATTARNAWPKENR